MSGEGQSPLSIYRSGVVRTEEIWNSPGRIYMTAFSERTLFAIQMEDDVLIRYRRLKLGKAGITQHGAGLQFPLQAAIVGKLGGNQVYEITAGAASHEILERVTSVNVIFHASSAIAAHVYSTISPGKSPQGSSSKTAARKRAAGPNKKGAPHEASRHQ